MSQRSAPDELAALRREHFGFIFQRYQLMADLTPLANVEVPAIYAGQPAAERRARAKTLLTALRPRRPPGPPPVAALGRPAAAGQRRARADERRPGDPRRRAHRRARLKSGAELMKLLAELNAEGHTVIIVTHDMKVAAHARADHGDQRRPIIADRADRRRRAGGPSTQPAQAPRLARPPRSQFAEAFAWRSRAMNAHRLRTFLTMLGIIIGIASVVSVVGLGQGAARGAEAASAPSAPTPSTSIRARASAT